MRARARLQSSIAVCGEDANAWALVNASPDITAQLQAYPDLQPNRAPRDTALAAIVLVDGQVDHTTGLYMLREAKHPWPLWCTDSTYLGLTRDNPVLGVLSHYCGIARRRIALAVPFVIDSVPGVRWSALPVASKPAPYSPNRDTPASEDNLALVIEDAASRRTVVYAPGLGAMDERLFEALAQADCVMLDGTFWTDDEMIKLGLSKKRARDIGHLPQSGPGGLLEWLAKLPPQVRKILIHINNTNPILDEGSEQRAMLERQGIEVAWDGMEWAC